jgi:hypothetical protein
VTEFPSDWIHHFGADVVTAVPPDGGGRFRYFLRLRPQPSFATIIRRVVATDPAFRVQHVGPMIRVVTGEGEYGAWVRLDGTRAGGRALRTIGAVFLGEYATALDTLVLVPARFAELEGRSFALLHAQRHGIAQRPRQFFYMPPVGWQALPSGLTATFYPPDFPRNRSILVVPPAAALDGSAEDALAAAVAAAGAGLAVSRSSRRDVTSSAGVAGKILSVHGRRPGHDEPVHRQIAFFVVPPWTYRLQLETLCPARLGALREELLAVATSFRPLPDPDERRAGRAFGRSPSDLFEGWLG